MSSKKICIVGPSKLFLSGISYYTIRLANALSESNEISIISLRKLLPSFLFPGKNRIGKQLTNLDYLPHIEIFDGIDYDSVSSWYKTMKFLGKKRPDVIIFQWWTSSVAHMHLMVKIFNAMKMKAKCILEMHETADPIEEKSALFRAYSYLTGAFLRSNVDAIIVHSESDKILISEKYRIDQKLIHIVPIGLYDHYPKIDKNVAKTELDIKEKFVILYFGLIRPYKGVNYLIEAFNDLPKNIIADSRLLIIGELWEDSEDIIEKIASSQHKENIYSTFEYVPDHDISKYFSACDVVVLPYTRASQSAVAHIAMCFGKPIVVSQVGGLKESMAEYEGTSFVPPRDPQSIAKAVVNIYNQKGVGGYRPPDRGWDKTSQIYTDLMNSL